MRNVTSGFLDINGRKVGLDELVDNKTAAFILGLSPRTVKDMGVGKARVLPVYKLGHRTIRFLVRDLIEWLDERYIKPL